MAAQVRRLWRDALPLDRPLPHVPSLEHLPALERPGRDTGLWRRWTGVLLDLVFPPFCPACDAPLSEERRGPLCARCWEALERIGPPWCRTCGVPMAAALRATDTPLCGSCRLRPPVFAYARAGARYGDVAREALHALKFKGRRGLAGPLADLLVEGGTAWLPMGRPDLLVPVPLHPRRQRERGFNQASLLARRIGEAWGVPVRDDVLVRVVATASQTALESQARRSNVRDAFRLRHPESVASRHVVVVDDILTTGATVSECALTLQAGGATTVGVLTVARVV
ncbi:MAG TPA: ComF family protein [Methylomirabilota bacterium]|nr:ComF family protein [Methylomirabilota bacterium]